MKVKVDSGSGKTVITMTYAETRQFISSPAAVTVVVDAVRSAVKLTTEVTR